jgi:hypothetical protein
MITQGHSATANIQTLRPHHHRITYKVFGRTCLTAYIKRLCDAGLGELHRLHEAKKLMRGVALLVKITNHLAGSAGDNVGCFWGWPVLA